MNIYNKITCDEERGEVYIISIGVLRNLRATSSLTVLGLHASRGATSIKGVGVAAFDLISPV